MIPHRLRISGFLSYNEPTELDFTAFDLACISGANGAGKSSLLDAITWVLFGQARRRDDALINSRCSAAEITLDFWYENNLYRVQRRKPKDKTTLLEFFIQDGQDRWRPLTEHTVRDTDTRIEQTLRMDYETFINASFFLQGRADQFAQQKPGDRKRILGSILGLEKWDDYRDLTTARRRVLEGERAGVESLAADIQEELKQEDERKARLAELEEKLSTAATLARSQEDLVERLRQLEASLSERRSLLAMLDNQRKAARQRLAVIENSLQERSAEQERGRQQMAASGQVESAYREWVQVRAALGKLDLRAQEFHEIEQRRSAPLMEIERARMQLQNERDRLVTDRAQVSALEAQLPALEVQVESQQEAIAGLRARASQRDAFEEELRTVQKTCADALAENTSLRKEMDEMDGHKKQLEHAHSADCPLCGQPLPPPERALLIERIERDGQTLGDRFRANKSLRTEGEARRQEIEAALRELRQVDDNLHQRQRALDQLTDRRLQIRQAVTTWQAAGPARLAELEQTMAAGNYAQEARSVLAELDERLRQLGYDPVEHARLRQREQEGRSSQDALRELETARARLEPLGREIENQQRQREEADAEAQDLEQKYSQALARLEAESAGVPDLHLAEETRRQLKENENLLRSEVGGARQRVHVLDGQRARLKDIGARRDELARQIANHKTLEKAFSRDGVPALLIEQALPEIETQANEFLDRLTAGGMSVRFATQRDYKDKNRDDKRETLDILISDAAGTREYELFSGGEAFRVNFAIRLALSRVLAQRAGARLQTLVIDEGFGSQDADGRQRLVEAINMVQKDFSKILVITHLEELKDAFPARIEVEKLAGGSTLKVVV